MDQAERLRSIVKQKSENETEEQIIDSIVKAVENTENQVKKEEKKAKVITVTSGKGGVGKSSVSINLAIQLKKRGREVIIFDADFGLANIEVMFGAIPKYTLADLMLQGKEINEIICEGPEGVMFVSGGSGIAKLGDLDKEEVRRLVGKLSELDSLADVIIVDTGAGISSSVLEFVAASPEVILVATLEPTSITDSYALLKALSMFEGFDKDSTKIMLLGNRTLSVNDGPNMYEKLSSVVEKFLKFKLEYLGCIPSDEFVVKAIMKQSPVVNAYPSASAAKAYEQVMNKLMGVDEPISTAKEKRGIGNFFSSILRHNKKN